MATAKTGPVDPTEATAPQSHATVVANSAIIVFREGLEAVLIFAAVTASFLGANKRPAWAAPRGDHRVHRQRRAAGRPQLVRPQGLLVAVDRPSPSPEAQAADADGRGRDDRLG